jgi:hypothetical protein
MPMPRDTTAKMAGNRRTSASATRPQALDEDGDLSVSSGADRGGAMPAYARNFREFDYSDEPPYWATWGF